MACSVKRNEQNRIVDVIDPSTGRRDPLYNAVYSRIQGDPSIYVDNDPFLRNLYDQGILQNKTKEEVALGIWSKIHQFWINNKQTPPDFANKTAMESFVEPVAAQTPSETVEQTDIYSQLGNKTQSENVVIDEVNGRKPAVESSVDFKIKLSNTLQQFLEPFFNSQDESVVEPFAKKLTKEDKKILAKAIGRTYKDISTFDWYDAVWFDVGQEEVYYYLKTENNLEKTVQNNLLNSKIYKEYQNFIKENKSFVESFKNLPKEIQQEQQKDFNKLKEKDSWFKQQIDEFEYNERKNLLKKEGYIENNIQLNQSSKPIVAKIQEVEKLRKKEIEEFVTSIFPNTQVKEILFHGTIFDFPQFSKKKLGKYTKAASAAKGFFFTNNKLVSDTYITEERIKEQEFFYNQNQRFIENHGKLSDISNVDKAIKELSKLLENAEKSKNILNIPPNKPLYHSENNFIIFKENNDSSLDIEDRFGYYSQWSEIDGQKYYLAFKDFGEFKYTFKEIFGDELQRYYDKSSKISLTFDFKTSVKYLKSELEQLEYIKDLYEQGEELPNLPIKFAWEFDKNYSGSQGGRFFLNTYVNDKYNQIGKTSYRKPSPITKHVVLNLTNPLIFDYEGAKYREVTYDEKLKEAIKNNNDGAILKNTYDSGMKKEDKYLADVFIAFETEQIHILSDKEIEKISHINKKYDDMFLKLTSSNVQQSTKDWQVEETLTDDMIVPDEFILKEITKKSQERLNAIQEIFNQNPELSKIGDVFSYASYLDTIFPDSKVKDIVYHGTNKKFDKFDKSFINKSFENLIFFFKNRKNAEGWSEKSEINIKKEDLIKNIVNLNTSMQEANIEDNILYGLTQHFTLKSKEELIEKNNDSFNKITSLLDYLKLDIDTLYNLSNSDIEKYRTLVRDSINNSPVEKVINNNRVISSIINSENPLILKESYDYYLGKKSGKKFTRDVKNNIEKYDSLVAEDVTEYENDEIKNRDTQYAVKEPEQIHILGSKQDIKGFKGFVDNKLNEEYQKALTPEAEEIISEYDDFISDFNNFKSLDKVSKEMDRKIRYLEGRVRKLKVQRKKLAPDQDEMRRELSSQIGSLEQKLAKAEKEAVYAKTISEVDALFDFGIDQITQFENFVEELSTTPENYLTQVDYVKNSLEFWKAVGTVSSLEEHLLYSKEELTPEAIDRLTLLGAKAESALAILKDKIVHNLNEVVNANIHGHTASLEDLYRTKDISWGTQQMFDIGTYGDALLATIKLLQKRQITKAYLDIDTMFTELDEAFKNALPKFGKNMENLANKFMQKYKDGKQTNKLVFRFSAEFFDDMKTIRDEFHQTKSKESYDKFISFMQDNTLMFNPVMLFPTTLGEDYHFGDSKNMRTTYDEASIEKHKQELIDALGEKDFNLYYDRMKEEIQRFVAMYKEEKSYIDGLDLSQVQKDEMLKNWELEHSPYYYVERALHGKNLTNSQGITVKNKGYEFIQNIPRRTRKDGSDTGYYDSNYRDIQADPVLAELYDTILNITTTLSEMLPPSKRKELGITGLPFLQQDISELFLRGNGVGLSKELFSRMQESLRSVGDQDIDSRERDPITSRVKQKAKLDLNTGKERVDNEVESRFIRYLLQNDKELKNLSEKERRIREGKIKFDIRKQVISELQKENTADLHTTLRAYAMAVVMYHHKTAIEDIINVMAEVANDRKAFVVKDGAIQYEKDSEGNKIPLLEGQAKKKVEALNYNLQVFFTGRSHAQQGVAKEKSYTLKEEERRKELENLLEQNEQKYTNEEISVETYQKNKDTLESQIENLGGYKEAAKYGDWLLKAITLKGLGWNVLAGINNMTFGYFSNSTEAAREVHFDMSALNRARRILWWSVGRNLSFNNWNHPQAMKIRKVFDKLDTLKDISTELYKAQNKSKTAKWWRWIIPFQFTKRGEYINQGQTALAYMLFNKIETLDGNQISIWEALDNDGNFKVDVVGDKHIEDFARIKTSVDQLISRLHGNYDQDSPLQGKETIQGRVLFQFKTWAPETFKKYLAIEQPDYILGDTYKGRYRTLWDTIVTGEERGKTLLETLAEFIKRYLNVTTFGVIKSFQNPDAFAHLSNVDKANMKGNIHQFIILSNLAALYHLIKYAFNDEDDDRIGKIASNIILHQISRLQSEMNQYSSPTELSSFFSNLLPMTALVKDMNDIMKATYKTIGGDYQLQSGPYEGWYRIPKEILEALPLTAPALRVHGVGKGSSPALDPTNIEEIFTQN